jgi:hypothetical protein
MGHRLFSRRDLLLLTGTLACLDASDTEFWNSKPPSAWDVGEIYRLMNGSPWAKTVQWYGPAAPLENGGGRLELGGMALIGPKAVVTWESAAPLRDALKTPPAPVYESFYVIGVDSIPNGVSYDDLKTHATLRRAGRSNSSVRAFGSRELLRTSPVYQFSFARSAAPIARNTGEVIFALKLGGWAIESRFQTKDMLYRGQLAL